MKRRKLALLSLILGATAFAGCDQGVDQAPSNNPDLKVMKYKVGEKIYTVQFALEGEDWVPVPSEDQRMVEKIYNDTPNAGISVDGNDPQLRHVCLSTEECDRLALSPSKGNGAPPTPASGAATDGAAIESERNAFTITSPYPTLFENKNFGGISVLVAQNIPDLGALRFPDGRQNFFDDKASSILGGSACGIRIYRYPNFRDGRTYQVPAGGNVPDLSKKYIIWPSSWNDAASSAVPLCPPTYSCDIDLANGNTNCIEPYVFMYGSVAQGQAVAQVNPLDLLKNGAVPSVRFGMRICNPTGWTFDIGHSYANNGDGTGYDIDGNHAQFQLHNGIFSLFDRLGGQVCTMPPTLDEDNCWNETFTIKDQELVLSGYDNVSINSPELLRFNGNPQFWAGLNRTPDGGSRWGSGLQRVTITIGAY